MEGGDAALTQEELRKRFGAQLRMLRRRCSLSLEALEDRSGISASSLSAYERGEGNPSLQSLSCLARALSVPIYVLIGEEPELHRELTLQHLKLSFAAELLRFSFSADGSEDLESCLNRCMALLRQFADLPAGVPDGFADREN